MEQTVYIEGMKCDGCANGVKTRFSSLSGVKEVLVSLEDKKAEVKADRPVSLEEYNRALADTKYQATEVK